MSMPLIEMRNITKAFPGVVANDNITLNIRAGQIHALLGENGSGKSTLMSILCGLYKPTAGRILVAGHEQEFNSPKEAIEAGIGMVHQHFKLINSFTVLENILLVKKNSSFMLASNHEEKKVLELANKYGFKINPHAYIWQLSVGERQQVEILKTLYCGSRVLILDEPTAVLTPQETAELFVNLSKMAAEGCAIIFITHKLNEVLQLSDCVTVLRGGKVTGHLQKHELQRARLAKMMVGRNIEVNSENNSMPLGGIVLDLKHVNALSDMGSLGLNDLNLRIRAGEIYCIAGVSGNGQRELAEVVAGIRSIVAGEIIFNSEQIHKPRPRTMIKKGVSYVPEDRLGMGLIPDMDSCENMILKSYNWKKYSGKLLLKNKKIIKDTKSVVADYDVKQASVYKPVKMMSGGNLQKLLIAREIGTNPKLMVIAYPSRGLDIGAIEAVHKLLFELKQKNTALLVISEELEEIAKLADTVGVIYEGRILGEFKAGNIDFDKIGLLMAGIIPEKEAIEQCR